MTELKTEEEFRQHLGVYVRWLRAAPGRNWKQIDLQYRLGDATKTRVLRLEKGEVPTTLGTIAELARAFDMGLVEFIAPVLGDTSPPAILAEAQSYASRTLQTRREALVQQLTENLERPSVEWLVRTTVLAAERMTDTEVAFLSNLLDAWSSRGWSPAVADAQLRNRNGEEDEP